MSQSQRSRNTEIGAAIGQIERMRRGLKVADSSLIRQRDSLTITLIKDAWEDAGINVDDPGTVSQFYDAESGLIIIDLPESSDD